MDWKDSSLSTVAFFFRLFSVSSWRRLSIFWNSVYQFPWDRRIVPCVDSTTSSATFPIFDQRQKKKKKNYRVVFCSLSFLTKCLVCRIMHQKLRLALSLWLEEIAADQDLSFYYHSLSSCFFVEGTGGFFLALNCFIRLLKYQNANASRITIRKEQVVNRIVYSHACSCFFCWKPWWKYIWT